MELDAYLSEKHKKKKTKKMALGAALAFLVAYVVLVSIGWFILWSPVFRVLHVVVKGNDAVPSDAVVALMESSALRDQSFARSLLGFRNMMLWPNELTGRDLAFIPQLASVAIGKDYFSHTITATVTERVPFAIWCLMPATNAAGHPVGDESCYWIDNAGTVFERTYDTEGSLMFSVHDYSGAKLGLMQKVLPDALLANMLSVLDAIRATGINVREIAIRDIGLQEVDLTTYNGPDVYFSLRFPAENDVPVLQSLMAKSGFSKLQYVDFRVQNRAYYK